MIVSPSDSQSIYPQNSWHAFTVELPRPVTSACSKYRVALTHAFLRGKVKQVAFYHVYCSICETSVAGGRELPFIGRFSERGAVNTPYYHNIVEDTIQRISLTVLTPTLDIPQGENFSDIYFSLHFKLKE